MSNEASQVAAPLPGERGRLIVVSAPSGAGKSSIIERVVPRLEGLKYSISFTTRNIRGQEVDGVDYHFISESEFAAMEQRGEFLEWARVHGNLYGTATATIEDAIAAGDDIILDIDVQGASQVRKRMPDAATVFVLAPSKASLESRLGSRGQNSSDELEARLANARKEVLRYEEFNYVIINDDLEQAANALEAIIRAERQRPARLRERVLGIIKTFEGD